MYTKTELEEMFDTIVDNIFHILHKGVDVPEFMDTYNTQKAHNIAMEMHRQGLLGIYYTRIVKEAI